MSKSWKASLQQVFLKSDDDRAWSSQEWKTEATTHDRSGQLDKTFWRIVQQIRPDHEEILLDGTAQSVRYEEAFRDRSGRPDNFNFQEVARPQKSDFSSTVCSAAMSKRIQQESGKERVTAKSTPMMNLSARMPSVVSSSTLSSRGKRCYGNQDPWRSVVSSSSSTSS